MDHRGFVLDEHLARNGILGDDLGALGGDPRRPFGRSGVGEGGLDAVQPGLRRQLCLDGLGEGGLGLGRVVGEVELGRDLVC